MVNLTINNTDELTFQQAIALSQDLLAQIEQGSLSETEIEQAIAFLVSSENGARGFFVAYLSGASSLADQPFPAIIRALQSAPDIVSELLVKNLAMSTAMKITHQRNQNEEMAAGSLQVQQRTAQLIKLTNIPLTKEKVQAVIDSTKGRGEYQSFLERWGYDAEQKAAIVQALSPFLATVAQPNC